MSEDQEMILNESHEQLDEDNEMSTSEVLQIMENAWLNEKFAPEILPNKMDIVESIIHQIDYFEEQLKCLNKSHVFYDIHSLELSRIRFIISSYIRIRLEKIEMFVHHILKQEEERKYLTNEEQQFAQEYAASVETLFNDLALQHIPEHLRRLNPKDIIKPNLNSHVVLKVNRHVDNVFTSMEMDESLELEPGNQYIMPYQVVAHLVKDGTVQLI